MPAFVLTFNKYSYKMSADVSELSTCSIKQMIKKGSLQADKTELVTKISTKSG